MKARPRAGMKVSGPPAKRMPGFSSQPWGEGRDGLYRYGVEDGCGDVGFRDVLADKVLYVGFGEDAAPRSEGGIWVACPASVSSSSISVPSSRAIWSMNAPVPPAQLPFMRRSACPSSRR